MGAVDLLKDIEHYAQVMKRRAYGNRQRGLPSRPAATDGATRTTLPPCCREKSRGGNRPALRTGSDWPDFRHENRWRSETSTINRHSVEKWWHIWELESS